MNERRLTGLLNTVNAVRPFDLLTHAGPRTPDGLQHAEHHDQRHTAVLEQADVIAERVERVNPKQQDTKDPDRQQQQVQRLSHFVLGRRQCQRPNSRRGLAKGDDAGDQQKEHDRDADDRRSLGNLRDVLKREHDRRRIDLAVLDV